MDGEQESGDAHWRLGVVGAQCNIESEWGTRGRAMPRQSLGEVIQAAAWWSSSGGSSSFSSFLSSPASLLGDSGRGNSPGSRVLGLRRWGFIGQSARVFGYGCRGSMPGFVVCAEGYVAGIQWRWY